MLESINNKVLPVKMENIMELKEMESQVKKIGDKKILYEKVLSSMSFVFGTLALFFLLVFTQNFSSVAIVFSFLFFICFFINMSNDFPLTKWKQKIDKEYYDKLGILVSLKELDAAEQIYMNIPSNDILKNDFVLDENRKKFFIDIDYMKEDRSIHCLKSVFYYKVLEIKKYDGKPSFDIKESVLTVPYIIYSQDNKKES